MFEVEFKDIGSVDISASLIEHTLQGIGVSRLHMPVILGHITPDNQKIDTRQLAQIIQCALRSVYQIDTDRRTKYFIALLKFQIMHKSLIILLSGPSASGKSTIATLLARSLGIPAVLDTDAYWDVLRFYQVEGSDLRFDQCAIKLKPHIVEQMKRRIKQRKSIIIEGAHLLPELYSEEIQTLQASENSIIIPVMVKAESQLQELLNLRHPLSRLSFHIDDGDYEHHIFFTVENCITGGIRTALDSCRNHILDKLVDIVGN